MIEFTVANDVRTAKAAASAFFWRTFRTHYLFIFAAGIPLFLGFIYLTRSHTVFPWLKAASTVFYSAMILSIVAYVPIFYFWRRSVAAKIARVQPVRRIALNDTNLTESIGSDVIALPWARLHAVWEYPDFFVLVVSKHAYWWIPKSGTPDEAMKVIRNALVHTAA